MLPGLNADVEFIIQPPYRISFFTFHVLCVIDDGVERLLFGDFLILLRLLGAVVAGLSQPQLLRSP